MHRGDRLDTEQEMTDEKMQGERCLSAGVAIRWSNRSIVHVLLPR